MRKDFLEVLYLTYPMLKRKEVVVRSTVTIWSDNRGKINLSVWVKRMDRVRSRSFFNIGYSKAYRISSRIAREVRLGCCVVHPTVSEYIGWEARFGFGGR